MFTSLPASPELYLELHRQRSAELQRSAAAAHLASVQRDRAHAERLAAKGRRLLDRAARRAAGRPVGRTA